MNAKLIGAVVVSIGLALALSQSRSMSPVDAHSGRTVEETGGTKPVPQVAAVTRPSMRGISRAADLESLSDQDLDLRLRAVQAQIDAGGYIPKANAGTLDANGREQLRALLSRVNAIEVVKARRMIARMD